MDLRESPGRTATRHPWEIARAAFFCQVVAAGQSTPLRVLDVGAGDGYFAECLLTHLPAGSEVVGCDSAYTDAWLAQNAPQPGLRFTRDLPDERFDCVVLLDVLEHVSDDSALLTDVVRNHLQTSGRTVVSVPAWGALFTQHDTSLGHLRRYTHAQLTQVLENAGLTASVSGGLFASLLLPRALGKLAELARGHHAAPPVGDLEAQVITEAATWSGGERLTRIVAAALKLDASLCFAAASRSLRIPGLSVWALGQKP